MEIKEEDVRFNLPVRTEPDGAVANYRAGMSPSLQLADALAQRPVATLRRAASYLLGRSTGKATGGPT